MFCEDEPGNKESLSGVDARETDLLEDVICTYHMIAVIPKEISICKGNIR
jgi:hypothetical protein